MDDDFFSEKEETPKRQPFITLCEEQQAAVDTILNHKDPARPIILTGRAGSGKSEVIKHLRRRHWRDVTVCATTGRAAMIIGGVTVDRQFNFSRDGWRVRDRKKLDKLMNRAGRIIVVDEASMVGSHMGYLLHKEAMRYDKQLVYVGDWAQAMPVKDQWPFILPSFKQSVLIKLVECHRQQEADYLEALNDIRAGVVTQKAIDIFWPRVAPEPAPEEKVIRMYATNKKVDTYNEARLKHHWDEHDHVGLRLYSKIQDNRLYHIQKQYPLTEAEKGKQIDQANYAHDTPVTIGCRLLVTWNGEDINGVPYVNGDMGELAEVYYAPVKGLKTYDKGDEEYWDQLIRASAHKKGEEADFKGRRPLCVTITLDRGEEITLEACKADVNDPYDGEAAYSVVGYPLRLGYAVTIHKSQGATVDRAWVDMLSIRDMYGDSGHGLAYVAMSRTKTLEGLTISGLDHDLVRCAPEVMASGLL
jgi:ATP-dependent DNA helicase PIF1